MKKLLFYLGWLILFNACKKDKFEGTSTIAIVCKPLLYPVKGNRSVFTYNNVGELEKLKISDTSGIPSQYIFEYNHKNQVIKVKNTSGCNEFINLLYNSSGLCTHAEISYCNNLNIGYIYKYEYNFFNRLVRVNIFKVPSKLPYAIIDLQVDYDGNCTSSMHYYLQKNTQEYKLINTVKFKYDNKKNPLYNLGLPLFDLEFIKISPNNIIEISYDGVTTQNKYEYTYNEEGYPETVNGAASWISYDCN